MAAKQVGVESPDFHLNPEESYVESVLSRQIANRSQADEQTPKLSFVKTHADEVIRFIEEHAIPLAVRNYRFGMTKNSLGAIRWQVWGHHMTVNVYSNRERFILKTPFSTYDLTSDIGKRIGAAFDKVPNVKVKILSQDVLSQSFLRVDIKFRI